MASVAGLSSDVVYDGNARSVTLNVKSGELAGAKVVEKNLKRVDEYVSLVNSVPFEWRVFGRRFLCEYVIGEDSEISRKPLILRYLITMVNDIQKTKGTC